MRALIAIALVWAFAPAVVRADAIRDAEHAFALGVKHQARPLLARKHFADAVDHYLTLHKQGVRDPALYLNLGNAAVLADRWPEALWAYHVGLRLDPNDARLRNHRDFVRAKVLLPPYGQGRNEPEHWPRWLHRPAPHELAFVGGIAYTLAWCAGTIAFFRRSIRPALASVLGIVIALACVFGWWYEYRQADIDRKTPLVIIADNTPLYRGNGTNYPTHADIAILPRGMEARQMHRRGGWVQIRLTSGEIGWIPLERALVVAP